MLEAAVMRVVVCYLLTEQFWFWEFHLQKRTDSPHSPLGAHFEGQPQRKTLRRETTLLEIRRNHQFLTKFGRRKAEVGKRWCAAPQGTQRGGSQ